MGLLTLLAWAVEGLGWWLIPGVAGATLLVLQLATLLGDSRVMAAALLLLPGLWFPRVHPLQMLAVIGTGCRPSSAARPRLGPPSCGCGGPSAWRSHGSPSTPTPAGRP
ncbi:MAG: hypothetical protein AAF800_03075 [Planctomycetota bacterium]